MNNNKLIVCNTDLHNNFGSDNTQFFDRIKHLEQMRTLESDESFTYFVTSEYEYKRLKQLHAGIRTGKIDFLDPNGSRSQYVFALDINKRIIDWLYNTNTTNLEKQLIVWMAVVYFLDPDRRELLDWQFHKRLLSKAKKLIQDRFSKYFNVELSSEGIYQPIEDYISFDQLYLKYNELCLDYLKCKPIYPLDQPWRGLGREDEFGIIGPKIDFNYSFMYERDWKTIILEGIPDKLNRAESTQSLIQDWKEVITKHEIDAHHIYDHHDNIPIQEYRTEKEGFVYLLSNDFYQQNLYKIGYTTQNVEDRVKELYTTGVPVEFNIEFRLPVNNLRKIEEAIHRKLRNFRVNQKREFFVGDKEMLIKTIKNFEKLR